MRTAAISALFFAAPVLAQTTLYVNGGCGDDTWNGVSQVCLAPSGPKRTVQAGIAAAANGDTIQVAGGTYSEHISFLGKAITVRAEPGITATISGAGSTGVVVQFVSGEGRNSVLDGFTVTGGMPDPGPAPVLVGGGIRIQSSSPTVRNCTITGNTNIGTAGPISPGGAGVLIVSGSPLLDGCTISANTTGIVPGGPTRGGGVLIQSGSASLFDCPIVNNIGDDDGGGVAVTGGAPLLQRCTIANNTTGSQGWGGGVFLLNTDARLVACVVSHNQADEGGGIEASGGSPLFDRCTIMSNNSWFNGGLWIQNGGVATVTNCLFTGNTSIGGALALRVENASARMVNCTVTGNGQGPTGPPSVSATGGSTELTNSIVWGNAVGAATTQVGAGIMVSYSDIEGGYPGVANINAPPGFVSATSFILNAGSPCIDSGNNAGLPPGVFEDIDGHARYFDAPEPNTGSGSWPLIDRGCYEAGAPPFCFANCDFSTATPLLNVNDYVCFLNHFAAGHPYGNCDGSVIPPLHNVNDFTCFLNRYAAGCP